MTDTYTTSTEEVIARRWLAEHEWAQGQWEYQCRLTPYRDGTIPAWTTVDSGHRCGGELRRRWVGNWEEVEQ